jgi:CRISPR type III-B/RAMP module-associated protein Cmr5
MPFNTIDQARAQFATDKVKAILEHNSEIAAKYKARAKDFPSMVNNDLLQALTFYFSKQHGTDRSYSEYLSHITEWFRKAATESELKIIFTDNVDFTTPERFIDHIKGLDVMEYFQATSEAVSIGVWLKRFADALIAEEDED